MGRRLETFGKSTKENKQTLEGLNKEQELLNKEFEHYFNIESLQGLVDDEINVSISDVGKVRDTEGARITADTNEQKISREELRKSITLEIKKLESGLQALHQMENMQFGDSARTAIHTYELQITEWKKLLDDLYAEDGGFFSSLVSGFEGGFDRQISNEMQDRYNGLLHQSNTAVFVSKINTALQKGINSEVDVRNVGKIFREEVDIVLDKKIKALFLIGEERKRLADVYFMNSTSPEEKAKIKIKLGTNLAFEEEIKTGLTRDNVIKSTLAKIRAVGPSENDKGQQFTSDPFSNAEKVQTVINDVRRFIPRAWVEKSNETSIMTKLVSRGYYGKENGETVLALSDRGGDGMRRCAFHEMGHRFEDVFPKIKELEYQFYQRRTAGCKLEWLGTGYNAYEVTRFDNFINSYMGKDYGNTPTSSYELLSMGMEAVYTGSNDIHRDTDYADFIYGLLVSI